MSLRQSEYINKTLIELKPKHTLSTLLGTDRRENYTEITITTLLFINFSWRTQFETGSKMDLLTCCL